MYRTHELILCTFKHKKRDMSYFTALVKSIQEKRVLKHLLFWVAILVLVIPKSYVLDELSLLYVLVFNTCLLIPKILASYFVAYFIIPKFLDEKKYILACILFLISAYVFIVFARILVVYVGEPLARQPPFEQETIVQILTETRALVLYYLPMTYATVFIFLAAKYLTNFMELKERDLAFQREKVATELKMLKAQLNPHFLFNTLNNIYILSIENSPKTPSSIEKLSKILDHVLYRCNGKYVSLSSEITLLENYIELEKLRYDDRLQISFGNHIEQDGEIAPLILLSLLENAFKHGAAEDGGAPKIALDFYNNEKQFTCIISNTITAGIEGVERVPIGLQNIKKQLHLIYEENYKLHIDRSSKMFTVTLTIDNNH